MFIIRYLLSEDNAGPGIRNRYARQGYFVIVSVKGTMPSNCSKEVRSVAAYINTSLFLRYFLRIEYRVGFYGARWFEYSRSTDVNAIGQPNPCRQHP